MLSEEEVLDLYFQNKCKELGSCINSSELCSLIDSGIVDLKRLQFDTIMKLEFDEIISLLKKYEILRKNFIHELIDRKRYDLLIAVTSRLKSIVSTFEIEDVILHSNSPKIIYEYAKNIDDIDVNYFEDKLLECNLDVKCPEYIYKFARDVNGANIKRLEEVIIYAYDIKYIYLFARDVENCDVRKLQYIIKKSGQYNCIISFAKEVKGANKKDLENAVCESKNGYYIYTYAKQVDGANITKLENALIKTKDKENILNFAKNIKGCDTQKLEDVIVKLKDLMYITKFACEVSKANKKRLENIIIESNDVSKMIQFAINVRGANIKKIQKKVMKAVIETKEYNYLVYFAVAVPEANKRQIEDILINCNDTFNRDYILLYAKEVEGADIERIEDLLIKEGDVHKIMEFAKEIKKSNKVKLISSIERFDDKSVLLDYIDTIGVTEKERIFYNKLIISLLLQSGLDKNLKNANPIVHKKILNNILKTPLTDSYERQKFINIMRVYSDYLKGIIDDGIDYDRQYKGLVYNSLKVKSKELDDYSVEVIESKLRDIKRTINLEFKTINYTEEINYKKCR